MQIVDLRSDTVTRPTPAMKRALLEAPLGDDVFGDDPTVAALQQTLAERLGFEAALFVPTGTQSNLCAVLAHCQRGDEYIVGQMAHCYRWEGGGAAVLGSVQPQPLAHQPDGMLALVDIEAAIKPDDAHFARSRLLCLENTLGGQRLPHAQVQAATALARSRGLATHLDGARLFNAAVAQAASADADPAFEGPPEARAWHEARRLVQGFDSVSVCLSKGLGAPVGSVLCGSAAFIRRAHRIRKMAGGGMRQAGLLAGAGLHAIDHHVGRLADDHRRAQALARGLAGLPGLRVQTPDTNVVFIDLDDPIRHRSGELLAHLGRQGVLATGLYRLRMVTHLDVDDAGIERAIHAVRQFVEDPPRP